MQLTFLGTSSGTPTRTRNVSGVALSIDERRDWYLIDCGEGTQHQILRTPLSLLSLRAILITHMHGDHCYGLPGLLASAELAGRTEPLTLIGPASLKPYIEAMQQHAELGAAYPLRFVAVEENPQVWDDEGVEVSRIALSHRVPSYAYRFSETQVERRLHVDKLRAENIPQGPLWHQLQSGETVTLPDGRVLEGDDYAYPAREARAVIVAGDNDRPDLLTEACDGVDLLVHEATYTEEVSEKLGPEPQHSTAARVARFACDVNLPTLILTHFSPRYQDAGRSKGKDKRRLPCIEDLRAEARQHYQGELYLAADLERYTLNRKREMKREQLG